MLPCGGLELIMMIIMEVVKANLGGGHQPVFALTLYMTKALFRNCSVLLIPTLWQHGLDLPKNVKPLLASYQQRRQHSDLRDASAVTWELGMYGNAT